MTMIEPAPFGGIPGCQWMHLRQVIGVTGWLGDCNFQWAWASG